MESRHQPAETARTARAFVDTGIDAAFINARRKDPEETADSAHRAHEAIPNEPVHPVRDARSRFAESDHGVRVKFIEPHLVFEEPKQSGLSLLKRIRHTGAAINQDAEPDS